MSATAQSMHFGVEHEGGKQTTSTTRGEHMEGVIGTSGAHKMPVKGDRFTDKFVKLFVLLFF